jgi:poly-gamma-glutamate synthesis protein (capsule biosynthesis protein)
MRPKLIWILTITAAILAVCIGLRFLPRTQEVPEDSQISDTVPTILPIPEEATEPEESTEVAIYPEKPPAQPVTKVASATIISTGDLLMHLPVINSGYQRDGSYDFHSMFQYVAPLVSEADYGVINLETTLGGSSHAYSGYPKFNCPDGIVSSAAAAGFDMLLTANNHCNDTGTAGFNRTLRVIAEQGMVSLGTKATAEEPDYRIVELNGIALGLICYTYTVPIESGEPNVNGLPLKDNTSQRINLFDYEDLDSFYARLDSQLEQMRDSGADAVILYIHWGEEYKLTPTRWQKAIAQELCDMGVDVIVGNHPHVVQEMVLLSATQDPTQKTVCLYSTGNFVSNQRKGSISSLKSAHMEDGVLLSVTFARYSDGSVALEDVNAIPLWVNRKGSGGSRTYPVLPLDSANREQWKDTFGLSNAALAAARDSYDRTMAQLGPGLEECRQWLAVENSVHMVWKPATEENAKQE